MREARIVSQNKSSSHTTVLLPIVGKQCGRLGLKKNSNIKMFSKIYKEIFTSKYLLHSSKIFFATTISYSC